MRNLSRFRWSLVLVPLALSLALTVACNGKVKQTIKNDAYSFNSAWLKVSQQLDNLQAQLLLVQKQVDENTAAMADSSNITAKLDSVGWVNLERYRLSVQQRASEFTRVKSSADSLQNVYEKEHAAYNDLLSKIDQNAIENDAAREKVNRFKDAQSEITTKVSRLRTRFKKAVREYNDALDHLKATTRNYRLGRLPEKSDANLT
ncbi:MAG: hypothetical protein ACOCZ8_05450 [Bacteroidota bacterium]